MILQTSGGFGECVPRQMKAEHVRAVVDGGKTVAANIVAACYECNHERGTLANPTKRGSVFTLGDDTPSSPFAGLRALLDTVKEREP